VFLRVVFSKIATGSDEGLTLGRVQRRQARSKIARYGPEASASELKGKCRESWVSDQFRTAVGWSGAAGRSDITTIFMLVWNLGSGRLRGRFCFLDRAWSSKIQPGANESPSPARVQRWGPRQAWVPAKPDVGFVGWKPAVACWGGAP